MVKAGIAGTEPNFLRPVTSPLSRSVTLRVYDLNLDCLIQEKSELYT